MESAVLWIRTAVMPSHGNPLAFDERTLRTLCVVLEDIQYFLLPSHLALVR
jgi:hypothetical protein